MLRRRLDGSQIERERERRKSAGREVQEAAPELWGFRINGMKLIGTSMLKGFVRLLRGGVVNLYMEATNDASFMADNEDSGSGNNHAYATSDPNVEGSGIRANQNVIHLIHDSDRTSDPEFQEAMENMDISAMRRKVRVSYLPHADIKVEQLNELTVNGAKQEEVIIENKFKLHPFTAASSILELILHSHEHKSYLLMLG
ncbi:hypothetical protein LINPERHAP1_LOCUS34757 [Linum perenne]